MIDFHNAETEDKLKVIDILTQFDHARQAAYDKARKDDEFAPWFRRAETLYREFCAAYGINPQPVFDSDEHIRLRIAQGHPDFFHYRKQPKFADVVPYSKPREGW